jgi:hypothetical protein
LIFVVQVRLALLLQRLGEPLHVSLALIDPEVGVTSPPNQSVHESEIRLSLMEEMRTDIYQDEMASKLALMKTEELCDSNVKGRHCLNEGESVMFLKKVRHDELEKL